MRRFSEQDRVIYLALAKEFYSSEAVLHPVEEWHFEQTFDEMMRSDDYVDGFLLEEEGEVTGYVLIAKTFSQEAGGMVAWIEEIYVRPEYQGKGIGKRFFEEYENSLPNTYQRLRLEIEPDNEKAIRLYQKLGYKHLAYQQMVKDRSNGQ